MTVETLDLIILASSVLGGAVGAYFSHVAPWKGGLIAGLATLVALAIALIAGIEQPIVESLIYLVAVGLIGRSMRLGAHQMSLILIGSFLIPLVAAAAYIYATTPRA